jgi:hypothetical protein
VGVGYSPDLARQLMDGSIFGDCRLMPPVTYMVSSSDIALQQAELVRQMWMEELGCTEEQIMIEQVQFGVLLANTRPDAGFQRPDLWDLGWASYYPDQANWLGDVLHCEDSENRQLPWLRELHRDPVVEIHPETAEKEGILEGDWVIIESLRGKVRQRAKLFAGMDPRIVSAEHGWWFPENKDPLHGWDESNINILTDNAYDTCDPAMGATNVRTLLCKIYPEKP